ncbi:YceI family protein [Naumannella cuiyingiana]|uniref:Polyisoprenoid-binding protein YceI n=1 Tax=Naumannella cuiyingiana TaxID=1347891 RepID=A0A7Z0IJV8_9ACTN|nr:polyisoprenoid-binding protein YceI [Naumannella cuiyingiana]
MTDPTTPQAPRSARLRTVVIIAGIVAALAVAAAILGPRWYAESRNSAAPPPLQAPTAGPATAPPTTGPSAPGDDLAGEWRVGPGSEAGYRIEEVLNGNDVTVVGRTDSVSGTATVAGDRLTAATIEVDVASIATDSSRRDSYFRDTALRADEFPTATFEVTEPVDLPAAFVSGGSGATEVSGELTLAGQTRPATGTFELTRDGEAVAVSGTVDVDVRDYGIEPPNLGFVTVEPTGQVEFLVNLGR